MQTVVKQLSELTRNPKNIRKHSDKQIEEYIRSVQMFGQTRPMVVDENGLILAGNGLYDALTRMGVETADCYVFDNLTPSQKDKLMLADNKVFELGISDLDTIEEVVRGLGDDLDVPGYDDHVLELITATVAEATRAVTEYGKIEPASEPERQEKPIQASYGETAEQAQAKGEIPYAPAEQKVEQTPTGVEERYIVCPHCGEKICL